MKKPEFSIYVMAKLLATFCLTISIATTLRANEKIGQIGEVSVAGEQIPALHFDAYADMYIYDSKRICPPVSDSFIRDQVIAIWLRDQGLRESKPLFDKISTQLDSLQNEVDSLSNPDELTLAKFELRAKNIASSEMRGDWGESITPAMTVEHYKRMVSMEHPGIVNTTLVKRRVIDLWDESDIELASKLKGEGADIQEIANALGRADENLYQADEWFAVESLKYNLGDGSKPEPGTIYGPMKGEYHSIVVFVADVKITPQLRPTTRVNMDWKYAMSLAGENLREQVQHGIIDKQLDELWEKFAVMVDGKKLAKPTSYRTCSK